ncbi:single-stranded DNA-binding protein [Heliobacterium undosum]|uniref:Single-stranded DNA-binding protein n=1 Tax=Heliomicrobium undosum TaxID=121734 RepID=A0A845LCM3_9FIRM|nr:single-stranded DNA-binding protein [Heliomicrobium undosum]MZP31408.1 single-stranded DNA-binding protein [Heliomicrobium undosum]
MLNRVILIGRLGQDPELRHTNSGVPVCTFSIAVDRPQSSQQRQSGAQKITDWFTIVVWQKQAENAARYLAKGRLVAVDGRLQSRSWTDQQSGQKRTAIEVVAETVRFLERSEQSGQPGDQAPAGGGFSYGQEISFPDGENPDDLPF